MQLDPLGLGSDKGWIVENTVMKGSKFFDYLSAYSRNCDTHYLLAQDLLDVVIF